MPAAWRNMSIPVRQIHGDRDHVLPHTRTTPDRLVHGGGHLLPMTHAEEVNTFLSEGMAELLLSAGGPKGAIIPLVQPG